MTRAMCRRAARVAFGLSSPRPPVWTKPSSLRGPARPGQLSPPAPQTGRTPLGLPGRAPHNDPPPPLPLHVTPPALVADLQHGALGQNLAPMFHQIAIEAVVPAQFAKLIAMGMGVVAEGQAKGGDASVDGFAPYMQYPGMGQGQADKPDVGIVRQIFVGDARGRG